MCFALVGVFPAHNAGAVTLGESASSQYVCQVVRFTARHIDQAEALEELEFDVDRDDGSCVA
jgi:hypothetical protein